MKLFLFGGAETGQVRQELKMIQRVINSLNQKQILHIPFARTKASSPEWEGDWFGRSIKLTAGTQYLNASRPIDIAKARSPIIFISGGSKYARLYRKLKLSPQLLRLIKNAKYVIGESSGAMILGEYREVHKTDGTAIIIKQLGIVKNAVFVPHYTQWKKEKVLRRLVNETDVKYGVGIDSGTAIAFELEDFPKKLRKIGKGKVELKVKSVKGRP